MRKVIPYKTVRNAYRSLDNGGRFYNLFTQANDGKISSAEVGTVAGLVNDNQKMVLFLEMSLVELEQLSYENIYSALSVDLKNSYKQYVPKRYSVSDAVSKSIKGEAVILSGIPKYVKSKSEFSGFIYIPIIAGNVTTMMLVPIIEQYDIYELKDEGSSKELLIAHSKSKVKLSETNHRVGGFVKELKPDKSSKSKSNKFLEISYYTKL